MHSPPLPLCCQLLAVGPRAPLASQSHRESAGLPWSLPGASPSFLYPVLNPEEWMPNAGVKGIRGENANGQGGRPSNHGRKASASLVSVQGSSWAQSIPTQEGHHSTDRPCQASVSSSAKWVYKHLPRRVMSFYEPYTVSSQRILLLRKRWEFAKRTGMLERRSGQREGLR